MIKHVVMFKLKSELSTENKGKLTLDIKKELELLVRKIDFIKEFEVGINIKASKRAFNIVLISLFDSLGKLEEYRTHPAHVKVVEFITQYTENIVAVDYEV